MKNPLLNIIEKSKYVTIRPDKVDGINVTRMIVEADNLNKITDITWMLMKTLDYCSGFYGYRITISNVTMRIRVGCLN